MNTPAFIDNLFEACTSLDAVEFFDHSGCAMAVAVHDQLKMDGLKSILAVDTGTGQAYTVLDGLFIDHYGTNLINGRIEEVSRTQMIARALDGGLTLAGFGEHLDHARLVVNTAMGMVSDPENTDTALVRAAPAERHWAA